MSMIGLGPEANEGDVINRAAIAKTKVADVQREAKLPGFRRNYGWWPSGATVLRVALIAIVLLIVAGWALTALNH